jgi:hypothetical protein
MVVHGLQPCAPPELKDTIQSDFKDSLLAGMRICVVDSENKYLEELSVLISGWGCHITTVYNIGEAVEDVDFILIDADIATSGTAPDWSTITKNTAVATVGKSLDLYTLPETVYQLILPIRPLQVRSLLLTVASAKRASS